MNTILVVTSDDGLFGRIARAFVNDGEITRLARGDALPRSPDRRAPFIVVDVRAHERAAVLEELPHYQSGAGPPARCVAIAQARDAARIGIITARGHEVIAAVFPDIDPLEHLLRAHLNDSSRSAAAAIACDVALRLLPRATHETLGVVFGGAFRVSLVKQLAIHHNADRTSIGKALRKVSDWTPKNIIDAAKASYAVLLLRQTDIPVQEVTKAVALAKVESLRGLLARTFRSGALRIREGQRNVDATDWLERELGTFFRRRAEGGQRATEEP